MDEKKKALAITAEGGCFSDIGKGSVKLPRLQAKVYEMLKRGKCSVGDISARHRISDPRGHIRRLRNKGVNIKDEWCRGSFGVRFKRYWIEKEVSL